MKLSDLSRLAGGEGSLHVPDLTVADLSGAELAIRSPGCRSEGVGRHALRDEAPRRSPGLEFADAAFARWSGEDPASPGEIRPGLPSAT
jgi:hypothetical protein